MNRFSSFPVATPGRRADEMTKHSSRSSLVENVSPCLRIVRIHSSRFVLFFSPLFFFSPNQFIPAIVRQQSANHETFNRDSKGTIVPLPPSSRRKKKKRKAIELCCFFISTFFSSILFPRNKLKLSFLLRISF